MTCAEAAAADPQNAGLLPARSVAKEFNMKTDRLFKENVYLRETDACITGVYEEKGKTLVTLDRTIFFPAEAVSRAIWAP